MHKNMANSQLSLQLVSKQKNKCIKELKRKQICFKKSDKQYSSVSNLRIQSG